MQLQAKYMKATWLSAHGGGFRGNTTVAKKWLADGKQMNTLIVFYVAKALKLRKNAKSKAKYDSPLEDKLEHFNYKNMDIGIEFNSDW